MGEAAEELRMPVSQAEYLMMEARLNRLKRSTQDEPDDAYDKESELQRDILKECTARGFLVFHGSAAHRTRRVRGEPDLQVIMPGKVLFVELKDKDGKPSTEQLGIQAWLRRLGHEMHIVRSLSQFVELIRTERLSTPPAAGAP